MLLMLVERLPQASLHNGRRLLYFFSLPNLTRTFLLMRPLLFFPFLQNVTNVNCVHLQLQSLTVSWTNDYRPFIGVGATRPLVFGRQFAVLERSQQGSIVNGALNDIATTLLSAVEWFAEWNDGITFYLILSWSRLALTAPPDIGTFIFTIFEPLIKPTVPLHKATMSPTRQTWPDWSVWWS